VISLDQVAIFLGAAVIAVPLFRLLKLSSILGYIAAGLVIGPWGLKLVADVDSIMHLSEFGVVLLLFIIGLEVQPSRLWVMRRTVFGLGAAQVLVCTLVLGAAAWGFGLEPGIALIVGFGLSLSSTPLVLQVLAERGQLRARHGRSAFGILLFQDLAALPVLAVLPMLAPHAHLEDEGTWWLALAKLLVVIAIVVAGGRLLVRPALRVVAKIQMTEVFTAAALLIVIGTALLVNQVGLSMALGAFLAGVLLADSEFRHELEADIEPFKGLLLGLFFVSVGMSANLGLLIHNPGGLLAVTIAFLGLKILVVAGLSRMSKHPPEALWRLAFTLPAGGEFAFVLFALALRERLLDAPTADLLVLSVTLSMMIGPLLLTFYEKVLHRILVPASNVPFDNIDETHDIIIAGFGRVGQIVARVLRARHLSFTALDSNQTQVDFVRRFGNRVFYGDASRLDLLRAAGAEKAALLVLAIDDVDASLRAAQLVRTHFPQLKIIARARNRQHYFGLKDLGITNIIRETFGSSLEMAKMALEILGDNPAEARKAVLRFREHDEEVLAAQYAVKDDEEKVIATSRAAAAQLEKIFEADARSEQRERLGP